ncbi:cytochrome c biogenesis protein CcsA [Porphyromonadaceae bacterium OttesenSCG-928-L07]|nr:cytochrome c biogenesis protein CcsA [Porphyromonadaceae bacterium OttesenSCG-928-L07]MDL2251894.1 cytochrome c biogenesis protein CcsA [Odoribacter sp. OttesenSCG-928-J03]MDL2283377.1 cytochrome c biogenesis protein CcsA [Odoribacter sp. OttesenSCG-928-G04]
MNWDTFIGFALPSVALWFAAGITVYKSKRILTDILMISGIALFTTFMVGFWFHIERPPMRTMGETRLWYSFFLSVVGYLAYRRWKYPWLLSFSALVASVFVFVNLLKPEIHSKNLMPALQSIWFVPHVTSYILSYAMLGAATIGAFVLLRKIQQNGTADGNIFSFIDNIVYIGFGFLVLGMLMGAVWAKEAWGHYWAWDPKETWAFVTSMSYLAYIHIRLHGKKHEKLSLWMLPVAFILLMITWIGVSYLPSAQGSIHVY